MPRVQLTDEEMEATRARLSAAAQTIYRDEGLEALTFRRLAGVAGISHTLPYRYFQNKEALLARMRLDALKRFETYVREREASVDTPITQVYAVVDGYIAFARERSHEYLLIFATDQPSPEEYPEVLQARCGVFDHAVGVVQRCIDNGLLTGNAREIAHEIWVCLHGLLMLNAAGQLVHGMTLDEIVGPLMRRLLGVSGSTISDGTPREQSDFLTPAQE